MKNGFKFSLSIATEPLASAAPVIFRGDLYEIIDKAKKIGYDAVELQLRDPAKIDGKAVAAYCASRGMGISAIATGLEYSLNHLSMIDEDPAGRMKMRERLFEHTDLAQQLGCPVIIGCVRGNIPDGGDPGKYLGILREEMLALADYAAPKDVTIVLEAINLYVNNYLNTVKETCDFIDSLGRENVKLHIDTHHMIIEEYDMLGAVRYAGKRIGYVHLSESNRWYPGAGSIGIDYLGILQILRETGYDGYCDFEVVPKPDEDTCAVKALDYLHRLCELVDYRPVRM